MIPYGPFVLHKRLAVGGMAEVFLAAPREREREIVVIKRLLPHLERRREFVQMFEDEARLTLRLRHPNIVRLEGFGEAEKMHYIVMEYVDGLPLSSLLEQMPDNRLPLQLGCWVVAETCSALAYSHALTDAKGAPLSIIHRDVSPDNILIARSGEVKLADFGIARASTRLVQTRPGQLKGKLAYMSPEQAMGQSIDQRSDIFSTGAVLYEATTGQRPFGGAGEGQLLEALLQTRYAPPETLLKDFPAALSQVVRRALSQQADQRYRTAELMRDSLLALIPDRHWPSGELADLVHRLAPTGASDPVQSGRITSREPALTDDGPLGRGATEKTARPARTALDAKAGKKRQEVRSRETAPYGSQGGDRMMYVPPGNRSADEDNATTLYTAPGEPEITPPTEVAIPDVSATSSTERFTEEMDLRATFTEEHARGQASPLGWLVVGLIALAAGILALLLYMLRS